MKAAIYNPYLDTLGGGERYTISAARVLADKGYEVYMEWPDKNIKKMLQLRFGIGLQDVNIVEDIKRGDGYDVCFWVSDGSVPALRARRNILHFQVPFRNVNGKSLMNKMKFYRIDSIVCNSNFTKQIIDEEYGVDSEVLYPPVNVEDIKPGKKENTIIFVGRFSQLKQAKNQHILVEAFKTLYDRSVHWKLVLAGGVEVGADEYIDNLVKKSRGYPISIVKSPSYQKLLELYQTAKIFWSAVGYGYSETEEPEKVEHFGMALVESMAAGGVPLAYAAGGHKEIITDTTGFLWREEKELVAGTYELIKDPEILGKYSKKCITRSKDFSLGTFANHFQKIIEK